MIIKPENLFLVWSYYLILIFFLVFSAYNTKPDNQWIVKIGQLLVDGEVTGSWKVPLNRIPPQRLDTNASLKINPWG